MIIPTFYSVIFYTIIPTQAEGYKRQTHTHTHTHTRFSCCVGINAPDALKSGSKFRTWQRSFFNGTLVTLDLGWTKSYKQTESCGRSRFGDSFYGGNSKSFQCCFGRYIINRVYVRVGLSFILCTE